LSRLKTTISGKRLDPFYGNAAADYTRVLWPGGDEIKDYEIFSRLVKQGLMGFTTTKTLTSDERKPKSEFAWTEEYWQGIQSMKLPNVGIYNYPFEKCDVPTIVSYTSRSSEESKVMTRHIEEKANKNSNIFATEFNLTCPNDPSFPSCYKESGIEFLKAVRESTKLPVFVKIGYFPEKDRLVDFGRKVEDIGIDGITAINSPPGMGIDARTGTSVVSQYGGVFGKGLKPLALRTVNILHENTNLELIGVGGVYKYSDPIEFLFAGANAVELSSTLLSEVYPKDNETDVEERMVESCWKEFLNRFKKDTEDFMETKKKSASEIVGQLKR